MVWGRSATRGALAVSLRLILLTGSFAAPEALATWPTEPPNDGLGNSGFEAPVGYGGHIPEWDRFAVEWVVVTDGDDGSDYSVYEQSGISVPPLAGDQSLLLGKPKTASGRQKRGLNKVISEPFLAQGGEVVLTFRAFSWETRGYDKVFFEINDSGLRCTDPSCESVTRSYHPGADLSAVRFQFQQLETGEGSRSLEEVTHLCEVGPDCDLRIDIGKNGTPLFDSGIYQLTISGIPEDIPVQLRTGVSTSWSTRKATWMYLDDRNLPPEAVIRVNPGDTPDQPALEGDFVVADCLQSEGMGIRCDWEAVGGGWATPRVVEDEKIAFFWFPDDLPVTINLTVTSADGQVSTASKSLNLINAEPAVNAVNAEVLSGTTGETICRFVDPGIGQYDDSGLIPGTEETYTLVSGGLGVLDSERESQASFSSGFFRISVSPGSDACVVSDGVASSPPDPFSVTTVDAVDLARRLGDEDRVGGVGGNETIATAHPLTPDWRYLAAIGDPEDIDVYRIVNEAGDSLPAGTELVVSLDGLPADYDLLVLSNGGSTEASPFFNAPFFNAPFFNAPFFNAPFFNAPFFNAQFNSVPFFNAPFFNAPFFNAPFFNAPVKKSPFFNAGGGAGNVFNRSFDELPLSEVGLAAPDGSNVSGSDISVTELGSLSLKNLQSAPGISLKALSAEPELGSEKVLVKVGPSETEIFVAVVGNGLQFSSTQPYALTIEASTPPSQKTLLTGTGFCSAERADPTDLTSPPLYQPSWSAPASGNPAAGSVLILTQKERYEIEQRDAAAAAVAAGEAASVAEFWTTFWASVDAYAAAVGGTVVSVSGSLFQAADEDPCSVATRNALVQTIRDTYIINPASRTFRNGSLQSVVLIGGQNIIPPLAVPDETLVGNEKDYTTDLWVRPGTPLSVAAAEGYNLTDASLTDLEPTPFRGRALYLEDRPVARFVERPEEIQGDIEAYLNRAASTNFGRVAYGYDFFCDGTSEVADLLGVDVSDVGLPCAGGTNWTALDLTRDWLNGGAAMCTAASAADPLEIANINAHMTTYAALSARGFVDGLATGVYDDVVPTSAGLQCLDGATTLTIGCHSGLNIPDAWALSDELNLPFDPALDWPQLLGYMVAPWGYGLGDNTVSNRGTEGLITLVVEELNNGENIGQALVNAKRRYVMSLRELDVHDEDSLINLGLFAPPQLTFPARVAATLSAAGASTSSAIPSSAGNLSLTVTENQANGSLNYLVGTPSAGASYDLVQYDDLDLRGTWFEIDPGDAQATYGRSLQPVTLPFEDRSLASAPDGTRVHGVALVSRTTISPCPINSRDAGGCSVAAVYDDLIGPDADGNFNFNPVFPLPQHDWVVYEDDLSTTSALEPFSCVEALVPTQLGVASTLDTGERVSQSLILSAGQFECFTETSDTQVRGRERLYSTLNFEALHPIGASVAAAQAIDGDFDPPQVLSQIVTSDLASGDINFTLSATDSLTGGNGIREIIALVYWEADDPQNLTGSGVVESYSFTPESMTAEPYTASGTLENAAGQRVAFRIIDGAGNLASKSAKGVLIEPVEVEILEADISITSESIVSILVGDFCELTGTPTVTWSLDGGPPTSFTIDSPPPGVSISIASAGCDATLTVEGIDFAFTEYGESAELTVEIRAPGAIGFDTELVFAPPVIDILPPMVLPSGTVGMDYPTLDFAATGGVGGYSWSLSGALPDNLSFIDNGDGSASISGPSNPDVDDIVEFAGSPYEFTLNVTDAGGVPYSEAFSIEVFPPPIVIETTGLPAGRQGEAYLANLTAIGGSGDASWEVTPALPEGLSLSPAGELSGIPEEFGDFELTFTLNDDDENVVDVSVDLTLSIFPPELMLTTTELAEARSGEAYVATLAASGGSSSDGSSFNWLVTGLPEGLEVDETTGEITGTPTEFQSEPYLLQITITDSNDNVPDLVIADALELTVFPPLLALTTETLPPARQGQAYASTISASGGSSDDGATLTWLVSGLPEGLEVDAASGEISGAPEDFQGTPYLLEITVSDSDGNVPDLAGTLELTVFPPLLTFTTTTLPPARSGEPYSATLAASGGSSTDGSALAWAATGLPLGLEISTTTGEISGTPQVFQANPFPLDVTISDEDTNVPSIPGAVDLIVYPPFLAIAPVTLADAQVGSSYSATISASGGSGNATWQLADGDSLPPGLTLTSVSASTATISGTPTAFTTTTVAFTLVLTDANPNVDAAILPLTLNVVPAPLSITPISLPDGTVNAPYPSQQLSVTGGSGAGSWSVSGGGLPPGLALSAGGEISGTPTTYPGSPFTFTATFTDADTRVSTAVIALSISVNPEPLAILTTTLPDGRKGVNYHQQLQASGGTGDYSWSKTGGKLPRGLSLSSDGVISGKPKRKQSRTFTVRVSDGLLAPVSQTLRIKIKCGPGDDDDDDDDDDCDD